MRPIASSAAVLLAAAAQGQIGTITDSVSGGLLFLPGSGGTGNNLFAPIGVTNTDPVAAGIGDGVEFETPLFSSGGSPPAQFELDFTNASIFGLSVDAGSGATDYPAFYVLFRYTGFGFPVSAITQTAGPEGPIAVLPASDTVLLLFPAGLDFPSGITTFGFSVGFGGAAPLVSPETFTGDTVELSFFSQAAIAGQDNANLLLPPELLGALVPGDDIDFNGITVNVDTLARPVEVSGSDVELRPDQTSLGARVDLRATSVLFTVDDAANISGSFTIGAIDGRPDAVDVPVDTFGIETAEVTDSSTITVEFPLELSVFDAPRGDTVWPGESLGDNILALDVAFRPAVDVDLADDALIVTAGATAVLASTLTTTGSFGSTAFAWTGPGGAVTNGSQPSGATISGAATDTLTIENATPAEAGRYSVSVQVFPIGGDTDSAVLAVTETAAAPADFNADGAVDVFDLIDFLVAFAAA